jgi:hypothetical protein
MRHANVNFERSKSTPGAIPVPFRGARALSATHSTKDAWREFSMGTKKRLSMTRSYSQACPIILGPG